MAIAIPKPLVKKKGRLMIDNQFAPARWVKVTLLLCSTLTVMVGATISPILPEVKAAYGHLPYSGVLTKLVLTIPALFIGLGSPVVGYLLDRFGRKKVLFIAIVLFIIGGTSGFVLESLYLILAGRMVVGIAVAGIMTTVTTLIGDYFTGFERQRFMGFQASFMAYGGVVFIALSGFMTEISWRFPFLLFAIPVLYLPLVLANIREPALAGHESKEGVALQADYPKGFVFFIYAIGFFFMASFYMIPTQLPFYLKEVVGVSSTETGLAIAAATLSGGTTSLFYTRVKSRSTYNFVYFLVFMAMGLGFVTIAASTMYGLVVTGLLICGFGMGMLMPNTNTCLLELAPEQLRGRIMGGVTTSFFLGQFFSPLLFKPLYMAFSTQQALNFMGTVLLTLGLAFLIGAVAKQQKLKRFEKQSKPVSEERAAALDKKAKATLDKQD